MWQLLLLSSVLVKVKNCRDSITSLLKPELYTGNKLIEKTPYILKGDDLTLRIKVFMFKMIKVCPPVNYLNINSNKASEDIKNKTFFFKCQNYFCQNDMVDRA